MANKKTVVEQYEEILANPTLTEKQKEFLKSRIEITQKKNARGKNAEPTPKRKAQLTEYETIENEIMLVLRGGAKLTPTELLKLLPSCAGEMSTQKLTPRLTALVTNNKVVREMVKGRSVYSLAPTAEDTAEDTED